MTDKPVSTTFQFTFKMVHMGIFIAVAAIAMTASIAVSTSNSARFDTRFDAIDRRLDTLETDIRRSTEAANDLSVRFARIEGHLQLASDESTGADTVAQR